VRVISGQARGRILRAPKGFATRPTSDRVKEAIFNVISSRVAGSTVLDVFAGTGGLGIEALSRGAEAAVFIEKNRKAWLTIKENLARTGFESRARVFFGDFAQVLPGLKVSFDLIFIDPPYQKGQVDRAVSLIFAHGLLKDQGLLIIETATKEKEMPSRTEITLLKESVYGDTAVLYYQ
jgi:16S rRNA (guanine966-N2)-methyltransferase